jgi:hypothetical protein
VEAIRALMVAKRTARAERVQTINQARALVLTGPDDIRARFAKHATGALMAELAALRPRPGSHGPLPHPCCPCASWASAPSSSTSRSNASMS